MRGPYRTKHINDSLLIKDLSRQRQRHQYNILSLHIEVNIYLTYKYAGLSMIINNIVCNYQRDHQRLTVISGIS
jgi:hypothetical protein